MLWRGRGAHLSACGRAHLARGELACAPTGWVTLANVNYDVGPDMTLDEIVDDLREAVRHFAHLAMHPTTCRIDSWPSCTYDTPRAVCLDARHPRTRRIEEDGHHRRSTV